MLALKTADMVVFLEADGVYRKTGATYGALRAASGNGPICFTMAFDLQAEFTQAEPPDTPRTLAVIDRDRECAKFTPWVMGYSPKEASERMWYVQLAKDAEARRVADAKLAEQRLREDREWRSQEQKDRERREWDSKVRFAVLSTVITVVLGGVCTYVGTQIKGYIDREVQEAKQGTR